MIEKLLQELIDALKENTAALNGAPAPKSESKPASGGSKPASGTKGGSTKGKPKGPKIEDLTTLAGNMLRGETSIDVDDAKAGLKAFKEHFGFKPSDCPDDKIVEAHAALKALSEGEDPFAEGEDEDPTDMV